MKVWPGKPYPLGATWDGQGVNFALFSENAEPSSCAFSRTEGEVRRPADPPHRADRPGVALLPPSCSTRPVFTPIACTGGMSLPGASLQPRKLVLDPYAKAIAGDVNWHRFVLRLHDRSRGRRPGLRRARQCAADAKLRRGRHRLRLGRRRTPAHALAQDDHLRAARQGLHQAAPAVPEKLRGTYAGLASTPVIDYLKSLGRDGRRADAGPSLRPRSASCRDAGCVNYWGYNTLGFFAPDAGYAADGSAGSQVRRVQDDGQALHAAGIEVILDVVYNHTAEGNHLGPTLSFRGIDNAAYYRLVAGRPPLLHGLHRLRQHAEHACTRACCSSSWTACATG